MPWPGCLRPSAHGGPLVYCVEGIDCGGTPRNLVIPPDAALTLEKRSSLPYGVIAVRGSVIAVHPADWTDSLYQSGSVRPGVQPASFTAIPFFAHANRQPTEMMVWLAESPDRASPLPPPSIARQAKASASHCFTGDSTAALNDQLAPKSSDDRLVPRFTWWDHCGTAEWVQYDFDKAQTVSGVEVYWWDERRINAHCRVPLSWRLLYQESATWKPGGNDPEWKPVPGTTGFGTEMDRFNRITFPPVSARALRIEARLQPG